MLRISVDDACASDVRVAELAEKYGVECTFYWPVEWHSLAHQKGYKPLSYEEAFEVAHHHEIGSHTITHRHLTDISYEEAFEEIVDSKALLESLWGVEVTKFCPPRGYTNEKLTKLTLEYYDSQRLTKGEGLVHVHPNSGANGNKPWREYYELEKAKGHDIECWGHSHEWDKFDMWDELEEFLRENSHS